jgi:poly-gamma-glutamate capsule biosynthesis protein CapA/YwtB (metallophosphatase superfamily)
MNIISIIVILVVVIGAIVFSIYKLNFSKSKINGNKKDIYDQTVEEIINSVFDEDFRQELKNRGKLQFERTINENATFLKQDLEQTTEQLHAYLKEIISKNLDTEFNSYKQTIELAKQTAVDSIKKTQIVLEDQRKAMVEEITKQFSAEKKVLVKNFENNMADIVSNYLLKSVGKHLNLNDQLEFIITDLETNKAAMLEDLNEGS